MFLLEWREFPSAPCISGKKKHLITARVSMLLKSRASFTCFRACFLPGWAKDLLIWHKTLAKVGGTLYRIKENKHLCK
jgi:hypothetical protein